MSSIYPGTSQAETNNPATEDENDSGINLEDLQKLRKLETIIQQTQSTSRARHFAIRELQELADAPLSPFLFRVLGVLDKYLAPERIPKEAPDRELYETLVFSASSGLWGYCHAARQNTHLNDDGFSDAFARIFPSALQWIDFFCNDFLRDLTQDADLRKNVWASIPLFLDGAISNPKMFSLLGYEIALAVIKLWILESECENSALNKHLPAKLLHKLIACYGEDNEDMIISAMESMGAPRAAQAAVNHLSSVIGDETHFEETRCETMLVRTMLCTAGGLPHSLLSKGVLRLLIKTLAYATRESYTDDPLTSTTMIWVVQNSCEALQVGMARTTGVEMCRQCLDFGILAPLLRADKWHTRLTPAHFPSVPYIHARLLVQTLATYTIYPCVLRAAAIAIEKVPTKLGTSLDKAGPMRLAWKQFKDVVQARLQVPGAPVGPFEPLACSNFFCPLTSPAEAEAMKKCAGCGDALYCGSDCQSVDWKNHKKICKELQAINDNRPTVPKEETEFAHKVALHELEHLHKEAILKMWRARPNNHSPLNVVVGRNGRTSEYEQEDPRVAKTQVAILDYEQDHTSDKLRPTIAFSSVPMFEHMGLPTMEKSAQRYRQEWNAIKALANKPQKRGMRTGIVVVRIPEGMFTVQKFFSLLPYKA